jgi:4-amino-4-deoxy-L-arabinose transferase-like glycosyltransferase
MTRRANVSPFWFLAVALLAGVTLLVTLNYRLIESDVPDSIGYAQASHQLAHGEGLAYVDSHNQPGRRYYLLYSFKIARPDDANGYFGFPPGVALLAAGLERFTGDPSAIHALVPILAVALSVVLCWLGALLVDVRAGWWAGLALLVAPTFLHFSTAFYSEVPSAAFLYAGCALAVVALRRERDDRWAVVLAIAAGLAIGATFFMRFSNTSVWPAVPGLIWVIGGRAAFRQRRVWWLVGVLILATAALLVFNTLYYGGPLLTGYSPIYSWYAQPAFSLAYAFDKSFANGYSVPTMAATLLSDLGGLWLFAFVGVVIRPRSIGLWLLSLAICLLAPYTVYAFAAEGVNTRFVIPSLPALCLLAGRGISALIARFPRHSWQWALTLVLLIGMLYYLPANLNSLVQRNIVAQQTIAHVRALSASTEPDAVILSYVFNDMIAVYGHRSVLNYRQMPPYDPASGRYQYNRFEDLLVAEIDRLLRAGVPVYYVLDLKPPLYQSEEILRRHFQLSALPESTLYRVRKPAS